MLLQGIQDSIMINLDILMESSALQEKNIAALSFLLDKLKEKNKLMDNVVSQFGSQTGSSNNIGLQDWQGNEQQLTSQQNDNGGSKQTGTSGDVIFDKLDKNIKRLNNIVS
jgi:hypothetical protein